MHVYQRKAHPNVIEWRMKFYFAEQDWGYFQHYTFTYVTYTVNDIKC
jgi:hypothetical protein